MYICMSRYIICVYADKLGTFENPAPSCNELVRSLQGFQPGNFWITDSAGDPQLVYCTDSTQCCGEDGGWMRIAYMDMTNLDHKCPDGFYISIIPNQPRACQRNTIPGCTPVSYSAMEVEYTKVCGRVRGYQYSSPDGFQPHHDNNIGIEGGYVDGVSITQGQSPRRHIWTFAAGNDYSTTGSAGCPCTNIGSYSGTVPSFVQNNHFCESGFESLILTTFAGGDPLWDGSNCRTSTSCCSADNCPWFCREVASSSDPIELRLCTDQGAGAFGITDEDIQLEVIELYIQ